MITIAGAGLAGLACAHELARRGASVTIYERSARIGEGSVSRYAGGMLAPWCEGESAEAQVITLGSRALDWWAQITPVVRRGTLVLAPARDRAELTRFAKRTEAHEVVDETQIAALEPDLAGRFRSGLHFAQEGHLDPRRALIDLARRVEEMGVTIHLNRPAPKRVTLDCTGMNAPLHGLRPVRGEMAILHAPGVEIRRTLRLLHPRIPIYLVPREGHHFMLGATMLESSATCPPTLRALSELMNAAYALHPGLAEASVVELGAGLRPAFANNLPQLIWQDGTLFLNGLYRHGFLLAPAMAARAAGMLIPEIEDADHRERRTA
ncbi:FAD-dependent oxidoreductase [Phaeobacter sp. PT47_59]|uniref:FAD-dependent oxidoreductase n=1 Tax=Phaeobacter sp. PT47_59 TaxID=3029979 RepID=UPI002380818B|nr:FAD-dependent oxidoreductase [Phaeobacter sp. PT47_59]MDE4176151.1 FAD-dependent oxidoreductase [Phaeobacter sp. PT47_59]